MQTTYLEYLVDLKNTQSLSKTADNFYTSRQAVNNAIKTLENELGVKLLLRTPKGVTLTEPGLIVSDYANHIIQQKEQLLLDIKPFLAANKDIINDELEFYLIPRFANKIVFKFLVAWSKKHKYSNISINMRPFDSFFPYCSTDKPFVYLIALHSMHLENEMFRNNLEKQNIYCEIIAEQTLGYCVSKNSKWLPTLNKNTTVYPDVPLLTFNYAIDSATEYFTGNSEKYALIDSFESQKELVKSGNYVSVCSPWEFRNFFASQKNNLLFLPGNSSPNFYYAILTQKQHFSYPLVQSAIKELKNFFN